MNGIIVIGNDNMWYRCLGEWMCSELCVWGNECVVVCNNDMNEIKDDF
jgi:hypothetical protein